MGGVTVNSGNLGVYNNGALGTGTLKVQGASAVFYTADTISNDIVFNSPTGFTGFYSGSYKSTTNNFSTTFTGSITGAMNNQQLRVGGNARTWIFGTINLTGMQSQGLQLVPEEASAVHPTSFFYPDPEQRSHPAGSDLGGGSSGQSPGQHGHDVQCDPHHAEQRRRQGYDRRHSHIRHGDVLAVGRHPAQRRGSRPGEPDHAERGSDHGLRLAARRWDELGGSDDQRHLSAGRYGGVRKSKCSGLHDPGSHRKSAAEQIDRQYL